AKDDSLPASHPLQLLCVIIVKQKNLTMELKKIIRQSVFAIALTIPVLFTSCDKDDDPAVTNNITDVVVANANFTTLEAAVIKANLQATLSGAGPFTVFAPDDAAFT